MKLFKGEMSLWKQLNSEKLMNGPGGLTDTSTYRAPIAAVILGIFAYLIFWNMDAMNKNFSEWLKHPLFWFIANSEQILTSDRRKHYLYAKAWLFIFLVAAVLNFFNVWPSRRRTRKSRQKQ